MEIKDHGGRRSEIDRRVIIIQIGFPDRRFGSERRGGFDRRGGKDRRSNKGLRYLIGTDRRRWFINPNLILSMDNA
ncbi:hypothetical protein ACFL9U_09500 [Thermodesulfobacteriota bacterium]